MYGIGAKASSNFKVCIKKKLKHHISRTSSTSCRVGLRPQRTIFRSGGQYFHGILASLWVGTAFSNTLYQGFAIHDFLFLSSKLFKHVKYNTKTAIV